MHIGWISTDQVMDLALDLISFVKGLARQGHIVYTVDELNEILQPYPAEFRVRMWQLLEGSKLSE